MKNSILTIVVTYLLLHTFKLIPFGFSKSKAYNIPCKSVGLAPTFPSCPSVSSTPFAALVGISFSLLAALILAGCRGLISSAITLVLVVFADPNWDIGAPDCSGGDGTGEDDSLSLEAGTDDMPGLYVDFGGPTEMTSYISTHY